MKSLKEYRNQALVTIGVGAFLLVTSWPQRMRMTPSQDALWQIPSAATIIGNKQFSFPENWGIKIWEQTFPIVAGPYLGAFKSYLLSFFMMFINNFEFASYLLNILLTLILISSVYFVARNHFGNNYGIVAVSFMLLQNGFLHSSMLDYGPFLIGSICLTHSLASFSRWQFCKNRRDPFIGILFAMIALGDKLTILPFVAPLLLWSVGIILSCKSKFSLRQNLKSIVLLILPVLPFFWYFMTNGLSEFKAWVGPSSGFQITNLNLESYSALIATMASSVNGGSSPYILMGIAGESQEKDSSLLLIFIVILVFLPIVLRYLCFLRKLNLEKNFFIDFYIYLTPLTTLFLIFVNYRPWHLNVFTPLLCFQLLSLSKLSVILISSITRLKKISWSPFLQKCLYFTLSIVIFANSYSYFQVVQNMNGFAISSPIIREASHFLSRKEFKSYVCLDYSICQSLVATSTSHTQAIKADFTFSENFVLSPAETLSDIVKCGDMVVTMEISPERARNQEKTYLDLLTKNSNLFFSNNLAQTLKLENVYSKTLDGTSIQVWEVSEDCGNSDS